MPGELISYPNRIGAGLLYPEPVVLAIATEVDVEQFGHLEIGRLAPDSSIAHRRAAGAGPVR